MNIIKSAKISRFLLKSVRDFNEFHTPRIFHKVLMLEDLGDHYFGLQCGKNSVAIPPVVTK